jgi:uncharacterized protein
MSIQKLILIVGLSVLFAGCSTGGYFSDNLPLSGAGGPTKMGVRYLLGRGVVQNDAKAFYYFNKAANEGDPFAQNEVAYMYAAGKGTTRDDRKALVWYEKAANHGLSSAQYNLGLMYLHGLGTAPNKALAMHWFQQSAAHGFEPARKALK